jgi:hypothetical protein
MCSPRRAPSFTGAARVRGHKGLVEGLTGVDTARGLVGSIAISCLIWKEGPGQIGLDLHAKTGQCVTIARVKPDTPAARSVPPLVAGMTLVSVDGAVVLDAHAAAAAISMAGRGRMVLEVRVPRTARSWLARRQRPEARREGAPSAVLGACGGAVASASRGALHAEHASGALPSPDNDAEPVAAAPTHPSPQPPSPHPHSPQPLSPPSLSSAHDSAHWLRSSISARSRSRLWSSVSARARRRVERRVEAKAGTSPARDRDRAEIVAASPARPQPTAAPAASRGAHDNAASRGDHSISISISRGGHSPPRAAALTKTGCEDAVKTRSCSHGTTSPFTSPFTSPSPLARPSIYGTNGTSPSTASESSEIDSDAISSELDLSFGSSALPPSASRGAPSAVLGAREGAGVGASRGAPSRTTSARSELHRFERHHGSAIQITRC